MTTPWQQKQHNMQKVVISALKTMIANSEYKQGRLYQVVIMSFNK